MRTLAFTAILLATACRPGAFSDLGDDTPVRAVRSPGAFPSATFGTVLATYAGSSAGVNVSRLVVSSGDYLDDGVHASVWAVLGGWRDTSLHLGENISVNCDSGVDMCAPGEGASLAPLIGFGAESGCVLAGAPSANEARVTCESTSTLFPITSNEPDQRFGAAVAGVPEPSTTALAFVGAPAGNRVAIVRDFMDQSPDAIDLGGQYVPAAGAEHGGALAVAPLPETFRDALDDELLLVVGEPGTSRVVALVLGVDPLAGGVLVTEVLGCVDRPASPRFGGVLAAGDLTGDGLPEVLVGAPLAVPDRADEILVFSADQLSLRQGCADETEADDAVAIAAQVITCDADGTIAALECTGAGFGSAFAIGNIDGEGPNELLASVPLATVDQVAHAGAGLVFPGVTSIDGLVAHGALLPLVDSRPRVNDTLGFAVAYLPTQLADGMTRRDEPVVAAPGANRVFVYLCSGLPGDAIDEGVPRCLVEQ